MPVLTVTLNDPSPAFDKMSAELEYMEQALHMIAYDMRRRGGANSGVLTTVYGVNAAGTSPYAIATYTYTAVAGHP